MERKEAIEIIKKNWPDSSFTMLREALETLIPELAESWNERIRKALIKSFDELLQQNDYKDEVCFKYVNAKDAIAWLEKQGEQDNNEDSNILQRFSFYSYKDEPNILYLSGLYVNEEYRNKGIGTRILGVTEEVAKNLNCHIIRLKAKKGSNAERLYKAHGYNSLTSEEGDEIWLEKKGKQKPTEWNEKDETELTNTIIMLKEGASLHFNKKDITKAADYLKSLKDRVLSQNPTITDKELAQAKKDAYNEALDKIEYHMGGPTFDDGWNAAIWHLKKKNAQPKNWWKPNDAQMASITCAVRKMKESACYDSELVSLFNDLKRLREE